MAKFLSRLFSSRSSSPKRGSFRGSQSSINDGSRRSAASSNMRAAASLDNLASYNINQKELEKHKLHKASWEGNLDKVMRHTRPDQLSARDQHSRTPLHLAVSRGHLNIVQHLVHEGAKMDVVDSEQRTPLLKAVLSGNQNPKVSEQICRILLSGGADSFINAVDIHKKNALHYAVEFGREDLVGLFLLVPSCEPNFPDRDHMTALHLAVKKKNPNIVYQLLADENQQQPDPNAVNMNGQTPLHMAAQTGQIEIVRMILQAELEEQCDPTIVDAQQLTAYQVAQANHQDACARIIQEYQEGWEKLTPRRENTGSINEREINPMFGGQSHRSQNPDDDLSESTSTASSRRSRSINSQSDRTAPSSANANKPGGGSLADLIKSNPLHSNMRPTSASGPTNNHTLSNLIQRNPLQSFDTAGVQQKQPSALFGVSPSTQRNPTGHTPASMSIDKSIIDANLIVDRTRPTAHSNDTVGAIVDATPHLPGTNPGSWSPYSPFKSSQGPAVTAAKRVDNWGQSSTTGSEESGTEDSQESRVRTPPAAFAQPSTLNGTAMFSTTTPPKAIMQHSDSEEDDSIEADVQRNVVQQQPAGIAQLVNKQIGGSYNFTSPAPASSGGQNMFNKPIGGSYVQSSPAPTSSGIQSLVNKQIGGSYSQSPPSPSSHGVQSLINKQIGGSYSQSSPAPASSGVQGLGSKPIGGNYAQSPPSPSSHGIQSLVNKQIGGSYGQSPPLTSSHGVQNLVNKPAGPTHSSPPLRSFSNAQSPTSEHSSWTSSSVGVNKDSNNKGISSLVQQQPLLAGKKSTEPMRDDSRPLSADLKRTSIFTDSSSDSDYDDDDRKSATIVKSPYTNPTLSSLVQQNIQPTESKQTGVENLTKIIGTIMDSKPAVPKQSTPPNIVGQLVNTPLIQRSDSSSSNASSMIDHTPRPTVTTTTTTTTILKQQQLQSHSGDPHSWSELTSSGHDFQLIGRNHSNEMVPQGHRQISRTSVHQEFNNLRSSMSSSTSSIQNNIDLISGLKENIKELERKQEDSFELKRKLKDMEIEKNNFAALCKKNDQLLRETETKLEKEINEKQRLEWTTKNLNMELKSVRQKLQSLEDEKDILNQRCLKLKEERDNYDEKLRIHQTNSLQSSTPGVLREEDIDKIKLRHREEMKLLSAENDDLHQRTRQLQSDLQLHRESLDVTIRYKIDLEKALEEKTFLQHELDRLKHEKDLVEQEKIDYKIRSDSLQEEIRILSADRAKIEQKLNSEVQEQVKQRQRSSDDSKKYKNQIEQLNIKLGDAEARLLVLQTQNEALIASKDREIKNGFETLTQRLNFIESEKHTAEQRYHHEHKEIIHKQQQNGLHEPLVIVTSGNAYHPQHSPSSPCVQCDTLRRSFEQEREQRLQTEKDNERLRDAVSRQNKQQQQENEHLLAENSKQVRSSVERVNHGLDRIRDDLGKLLSNYDPPNNFHQQAQLHSQIETMRQFYEDEFRKQQQLLNAGSKSPVVMVNGYHRRSSVKKHDDYDHSHNGSLNCSICSNSRLLRERLDNAIDTSLADQRIQTIKQIPILPRQTSPLLTTNNTTMSSVELLRKRYYI